MSDTPSAPSSPAPSSPAPSNAAPVAKAPTGPSGSKSFNAAVDAKPAAKSLPPPDSKAADVAPAPEPPAAVEERKARKLKIKVDGAEEEIDLDAMSDEEAAKHFQMSKAARKRMQEAAALQKQFASIQEAIRKDPFAALKDPAFGGLDLEALAEERLAKRYQEQMMAPEELERQKLKAELESYKAKETERETKAREAQQAALEEQVRGELEQEFIAGLEESGLPKTPQTIRLMAEVARENLIDGIEMSRQQITAEVNKRISEQHQHITRSMDGEQLAKHLGEDVVKKILKHAVEKAKASRTFTPPPPSNQAVDLDEHPQRKIQNYAVSRKFFKGIK